MREAMHGWRSDSARAVTALQSSGAACLSMPTSSRWLLVAAYLASRCLPRMDAALFGVRQKAHLSKRTKRARVSTDEQHNFTMTRLFAIYAAIRTGVDHTPTTDQLVQLSSLLHMKLLARVSRPEELNNVRLSCTASWETVEATARELKFDLGLYVEQ